MTSIRRTPHQCTCGGSLGLSDTELQIIVAVANGVPVGDVAAGLHHTKATIATYVSRARGKLGARDRAHMVTRAVARGIIKISRDGEAVLAHPVAVAS